MTGKRITEPGFTDRPVHGRAFRIALAVIGTVAMIQFLALALAILRREPSVVAAASPAPPAVAPAPSVPVDPSANAVPPAPVMPSPPLTKPTAPDPVIADVVVNDPVAPAPMVKPVPDAGPEFLGPAGEPAPAAAGAELAKDPAALFASLQSAAKSQVLADGILERLMATGAELRGSGNTQGALRNFREVESAQPDHPRVLAEIAATLGLLGLKDKQQGYWERVEALGPAGAGPYFTFALEQLGKAKPGPPAVSESGSTGAPESAEPEPAPGKLMKIGEVKVVEEAPTAEGQKVSLSVVIDAVSGSEPVGEDLSLLVYFYDRAAGGAVLPSTADTSYLYPTEPYDWKVNGTETIVVNYLQPVFTGEQKRELGERSFHGYAIELYYRDELQDKIAMPEDVAALRIAPAAESDPESRPVKPENALFPNAVVP
jgi:hypothetical protein